jgi:hypothetical protein
MKTATDYEVAALSVVNLTREYFGHNALRAMPPGVLKNTGDCSIQRALRDIGLGVGLEVHNDRVSGVDPTRVKELAAVWCHPSRLRGSKKLLPGEVPLPGALRCFVELFDSEQLLHLRLEDIVTPADMATVNEEPIPAPIPVPDLETVS